MVKNRNPIVAAILSLVTFGIYGLYWLFVTIPELRELGQQIPTRWLFLLCLIPGVGVFVGLFFAYKYGEATEAISSGSQNKWLIFVLMALLFPVGIYLVQTELNKKA